MNDGLAGFFDLIAMPKGQAPGGPIQASNGRWYMVLPVGLTLTDTIEVVMRGRSGVPVTTTEIEDLLAKAKRLSG